METVRLGIIGVGAQGGFYSGFLSQGKVKGMVLGALCDIDPTKKAMCAEKYPDVPFYENYIDMMESGNVDAVVTCVPHYLHPEIGIAALSRDLHALIEKPAGVYTKQVQELNDYAAAKPELTFGIMFIRGQTPFIKR